MRAGKWALSTGEAKTASRLSRDILSARWVMINFTSRPVRLTRIRANAFRGWGISCAATQITPREHPAALLCDNHREMSALMMRYLFVCTALLVFAPGTFASGEYQHTKDGKTTVWNNEPKPGDE